MGEGHSDATPKRSRMRGSKLTSVDCLLDDSSHLPPEHRAQELVRATRMKKEKGPGLKKDQADLVR